MELDQRLEAFTKEIEKEYSRPERRTMAWERGIADQFAGLAVKHYDRMQQLKQEAVDKAFEKENALEFAKIRLKHKLDMEKLDREQRLKQVDQALAWRKDYERLQLDREKF